MLNSPESATSAIVREGLQDRLLNRATAQGSIALPAVPAMIDDYVGICLRTFIALGVEFSTEQEQALRAVLLKQLQAAFDASPRSQIEITYESPIGSRISYHVSTRWSSIETAYDNWVDTREPPFFGSAPDAKVMSLAATCSNAQSAPVLDLGAGTGRNALPLARAGHPVDAIELTGRFAELLEEQAQSQSLSVRVLRRDALFAPTDLRRDYHLIIASEFVTDFRSDAQLRRLFDIASSCLAPGGCLLMSVFLTVPGYLPDEAARQLSQQMYSSVFTREEVRAARAGLTLTEISDESVLEYERDRLPAEEWPPTQWFERWASGRDVFADTVEDPPMELRWLVFQKGA